MGFDGLPKDKQPPAPRPPKRCRKDYGGDWYTLTNIWILWVTTVIIRIRISYLLNAIQPNAQVSLLGVERLNLAVWRVLASDILDLFPGHVTCCEEGMMSVSCTNTPILTLLSVHFFFLLHRMVKPQSSHRAGWMAGKTSVWPSLRGKKKKCIQMILFSINQIFIICTVVSNLLGLARTQIVEALELFFHSCLMCSFNIAGSALLYLTLYAFF